MEVDSKLKESAKREQWTAFWKDKEVNITSVPTLLTSYPFVK